jgi:dTDP-4-dehydrorhamnose 3,5-epimerase
MKIEKTEIEGVYIIDNFNAADERGLFVKTYNKALFEEYNIDFEIRESYYSISKKNVIRGMHFQLPPYDHEKFVYVAKGSILDVIVDLRKKSKTYKQYLSINLSEENKKAIFIPKGLAHGFKSLVNDTITVYNVATEYNNTADAGISYDSFGFDWEVKMPILSARDASFNILKEFHEINPFS